MTRFRWLTAACACTLLLQTPVLAQEPPDSFRLREIVVTATRLPLPRVAVPAAVTVLEGDELRARGIRFVADALRTVPGAAVARNGSAGGLTSLFLRGGESDYVQVLIDGVQLNEPGGSFDFGQLTTDNVDRIEIVRGPVGVLYGSDAVTGVVHIFTRSGTGRPTVTASASAGRADRVGPQAEGGYGMTVWDAALAGASARADYSLGASGYDSDGAYAFNNGYENLSIGGRSGARVTDRSSVAISGRFTDGEFHFPTDGGGALVDHNQFSRSRSLALGLEATHFLTQRIEATLLLALHDLDRTTDDRQDNAADTLGSFVSRFQTKTERRSADLRVNLNLGTATILTLGGEAERESGTTSFTSDGQFGPFKSATDDERANLAGYAQLVASPAAAITLTAGLRAEDNEQFGGFTTYRAGANYRARTGTLLRAAAGTGFKEPTFFENFAEGFVRGNPDLEPERSQSWEVGVEQELRNGQIAFGITYFDQRFRNLIQFTSQPPSPGLPNYFNVGEATSSGVELTARFSAPLGLDITGSYGYVDTEVLDEGYGADRAFFEGQPLLRRPKHSVSVGAGYTVAGRGRITATLQHTGQRHDLDFSDPVEFAGIRVVMPAYTTLDLAGEYGVLRTSGVLDDIAITARIRNALNQKYQEIRNFHAAGREVSVGVRARIGLGTD